jgi:hypothetical protein
MRIIKALKLRKILIVNYVFLFWIPYYRYCLPKFQGRIKAWNLILLTKLTRVTKYNDVEKVNIRGTNLGFEQCTSYIISCAS